MEGVNREMPVTSRKERVILRCSRASIVLLGFLGGVSGYCGVLMMVDPSGSRFTMTGTVMRETGLSGLFWSGLIMFLAGFAVSGVLIWLLIDDPLHHKNKILPQALVLTGACTAWILGGVSSLFVHNICLTASVFLLVLAVIAFVTRPTPKLK